MRNLVIPAALIGLALVTGACASLQTLVGGPCGPAVAAEGPGFTVVGSFETTLDRLRAAMPLSKDVVPALPGDTKATFCFIDGEFPVSQPPPIDGVTPRPLDRGLMVVVGDFVGLLEAGYKENLPVRDPT